MIELRVSEPDPIVLEAEEQDQASLAVLEAFVSGGDIPAYTGSYNVTPTQSQQTLETNGKKMVRDVKVAPIPSQYIIPEGTLEVTQNGQQSVREYENVNVNVPAPTGEKTINVSQNGTVTEDVANYATAKVVTNVPASAVDSGTKSISANGNGQDVVGYAAVNVNVPNSYAAADEGKVVQSGALVTQTSDTVTQNGTYDTTTKNEVVVDVQGGGGEDFVKLVNGSITSVDNSDITTVRERAFAACGALTSVSLPNATSIGISAFSPGCTALTSVYLPKVATITNNCFDGVACSTLAFPSLTSATGSYSFRNNTHLTAIDMGNCSSLGAQCFAGDTNLTTIVLRSTSITALGGGTAVFNNTPFKSGGSGGTIYIPKSLYDHLGDNSASDYKKASNWVTIDGYGTITWAKIEGSYYETHYADGTPIT